MTNNRIKVAVIAGDGIGKEVVPEGIRALDAAASKFDIKINFDYFNFSSYDYYLKEGKMLPED
jgi:tartrate dehydrogenase/decarboxylase/D-malate dehydrogenase